MTSPVLPPDVFDEIISQLTNKTTLESCSIVCRSFCRSAQKILFNSIVVPLVNPNGGDTSQTTNFVLIVEQAPHLVEHIQKLRIRGDCVLRPGDCNTTDLPDALGIFSRKGEFPINLRSLWLEMLPWHNMTSRLQDAIVLLMTVQSLRDITLDHVRDRSTQLVQNLPPLMKYLTLIDHTTLRFASLPTTGRKELPKLEYLAIICLIEGLDQFPSDAMERIVDMTQLKTFVAALYKLNSMPLIEQILRSARNSLEHLILQFEIIDLDPVPVDLNQFPQLTDITFEFMCHPVRTLSQIPPTIILITKTMKKISHRNVIRNLSFCLFLGSKVDMADAKSAMEDVWQELDTICFLPQLMLSNSFRGITFNILSTVLNVDAFSDLVRNRLPETRKANKLHIKAECIW